MSRQASDQLYIELGYFTPEEYYVYTAEAVLESGYYIDPDYIEYLYYEDRAGNAFATLACDLTEVEGTLQEADAALSSTVSVTALVGVVKEAAASVSAAFSTTATISHIEGADLFAFSEAQLALAVARLRDYSASLDSIFDIATDYIRIKQLSADAALAFTQSSDVSRSRGVDSNIQAAFSLSATANANTKSASATITSTASVTATFTGVTNLVRTRLENAFVLGATVSPFNPGRPLTQSANTLGAGDYSTSIKKFGTHSALIRTDNSVTYTIPNNTSFDSGFLAIEFWIYSNPINVPLFDIRDSSGTSRYVAITGSSSPTAVIFGVTSNAFRSVASGNLIANEWNHVLCLAGTGTNNTTIYLNGVRGSRNTHDGLGLNNGSARIGFSGYNGSGYVDDFRVIKGNNSWPNGWNPNNSTVTVPTEAFINDDRTSLLVHFDANANDDISIPIPVKALLSLDTRLEAVAQQFVGVVASLSSTATLTADTTNIIDGIAAVASAANINTNGGYVLEGSASITDAMSFNATVGVAAVGAIESTTVASLSATGIRAKGFNAAVNSTATLSASGQRIRFVNSTISSSASLSADAIIRFKGAAANISAASSLGIVATIYDGTVWPADYRSLFHFDNSQTDELSDSNVTWREAPTYIDSDPYFAFSEAKTFGKGIYLTRSTGQTPLISVDRTTGDRITRAQDQNWCMELFVRVPSQGISSNSIEQTIWQYFDVGSNEPVSLQYQYSNPVSNPSLISFRILGAPQQAILLQTGSYALTNYSGYSQYIHVAVQFTKVYSVGNTVTGNYEIFVNGVSADTRTNHESQKSDGALILPGSVVGATFRTVIIEEPLLRIGYNYPGNFTVRNTPYVPYDSALIYIDATSSLTVPVSEILVRATADISSTTAFTASADKIRSPGARTLTSTFTQSTSAVKTARIVFARSATATMSVTAVKTARVVSNQSSEFTQTASGRRVRLADSVLSTSANLDLPFAEILKTPGNTLVTSEFSQTTVNARFRDNEIDTDSIATQLSAVAKIGDFLITLESASQLSAEAFKQTDVVSNLIVEATCSADPIKTVFGEAAIASQFSVAVIADKIKRVDASIGAEFSVAIPGQKVTDTSSGLVSTFTTVSTPNRIRDNAVGLNTTTALAVPITEIVIFFDAALQAQATGLFIITKLVRAQANLQVSGFQLTAGRVIHIDEYYTLIVPQENRIIKVQSEDRTIIIDQETRKLTV